MRTHLFPGGLMAAALLCLTAMGCSNSDDSTSSTTKAATAWTAPDDEIRIGIEEPLTGAQSDIGKGMLNGARMTADELNAVGGIDGRMITIVGIDDQADPDTGASAATVAIAEGLGRVVGPHDSSLGAETLLLYIDVGLVPLRLTSADETARIGFTLQPMTALFHEPSGTWAPYTRDSAVPPASAASDVDGFDEARLRSALEAIGGWPGWTGSVSFDAPTGNRQPAPVVVLSTQDDGTLHLDEAWSTTTGFKF